MSAIIRAATLADASLLAELHGESFAQAWDAASFHGLLQNPAAIALLIQTDSATELQGFILMQVAADQAEILAIAIRAAVRRRGLASALLNAAAAEAFRRDAKEMFLEVADDNAAALALYEKAGFMIVGGRHGYYSRATTAIDALLLRATLPF